jgi:translation initiation factor IF-1
VWKRVCGKVLKRVLGKVWERVWGKVLKRVCGKVRRRMWMRVEGDEVVPKVRV